VKIVQKITTRTETLTAKYIILYNQNTGRHTPNHLFKTDNVSFKDNKRLGKSGTRKERETWNVRLG